jgi:hypothetical protein
MTVNQIFNKNVPEDLVLLLLSQLNINNFSDNKRLSYQLIDDNMETLMPILDEIKLYYLPCKSKVYFNTLNSKKIITIIRQLLKLYNYKLYSKERYSKETKMKFIEFTIRENLKNNITRVNTNLVLSFN